MCFLLQHIEVGNAMLRVRPKCGRFNLFSKNDWRKRHHLWQMEAGQGGSKISVRKKVTRIEKGKPKGRRCHSRMLQSCKVVPRLV